MEEFNEEIQQELKNYVYALVDPKGQPFYIGMGKGNRIFDHEKEAKDSTNNSDKVKFIRKLDSTGEKVEYIILRHGLNKDEALLVESVLIDCFEKFNGSLTNIVLGHDSRAFGIMTLNDILRLYQAPPLNYIEDGCVIININKRYERMFGANSIYEATRQSWVISKDKIGDPLSPKLNVVLSEYRGFIVEVFQVMNWFSVSDENGKLRWGFNGRVASQSVREKYLNHRITKKRGMANPVRYKI